MEHRDFVIVGGGIMGAMMALRLAESASGSILLVEKSYPGAGSTGKSGAILRQHYSHKVTIGMARESLHWYCGFEDQYGLDISFNRPGMAFICNETDRENLERNVQLQQSLGVDTTVIDSQALRELEPAGSFADEECAAWEPEAGNVNPVQTVHAVLDCAIRAGADVRIGVRVTGFLRDGDRIQGIELDDGSCVAAGMVIVAAGPWAGKLLEEAGVPLPLQTLRPEQAYFEPPAGAREKRLIYGDLTNGLYWKPELAGWTRVGLLDMNDDAVVDDPDHYDEGVSGEFISECRERISRRLPHYGMSPSWGGVAALYTVTPDSHPLIGPVPGLEGIWVVSGFSGHGFKMAPAVGRGVAAAIGNDQSGNFEADFFAPDRFARKAPIEVSYGYGILG
jgi:glycine/D-amino acid oxidase-like deaminating enzyme